MPRDYCINVQKYFLSTSIANNVLNLMVLAIPISLIGRIYVCSAIMKAGIGIVFLIGILLVFPVHILRYGQKLNLYSACIASVLRSAVIPSNDTGVVSWGFVPALFWGFVEIAVSVVASCLSAMIPLIRTVIDAFRSPRRGKTSAAQVLFKPSRPSSQPPQRPSRPNELPTIIPLTPNSQAVAFVRRSDLWSMQAIQISNGKIIHLSNKELVV